MAGFKPKGWGRRGKPTHRTAHHRQTAKGNFARGASCPCTKHNLPKPFTEEATAQGTPLALTSLHTNMVPNTTCRPSKKLSPMMITVAPPVVQPSLGLMALMHGVAAHTRQRTQTLEDDLTSGAHAAHLKSYWRPREEGHAAPPGTGKGQS